MVGARAVLPASRCPYPYRCPHPHPHPHPDHNAADLTVDPPLIPQTGTRLLDPRFLPCQPTFFPRRATLCLDVRLSDRFLPREFVILKLSHGADQLTSGLPDKIGSSFRAPVVALAPMQPPCKCLAWPPPRHHAQPLGLAFPHSRGETKRTGANLGILSIAKRESRECPEVREESTPQQCHSVISARVVTEILQEPAGVPCLSSVRSRLIRRTLVASGLVVWYRSGPDGMVWEVLGFGLGSSWG